MTFADGNEASEKSIAEEEKEHHLGTAISELVKDDIQPSLQARPSPMIGHIRSRSVSPSPSPPQDSTIGAAEHISVGNQDEGMTLGGNDNADQGQSTNSSGNYSGTGF